MELNFFQSLILGFFSGFADILPVSAQAHRALLLKLFGAEGEPALLRLMVHIAVLMALFSCCRGRILGIRKQIQLSKIPKGRRKRPLDIQVLMDYKLLKMAAVPAFLGYLLYTRTSALNSAMNWIALLSFVNAMILFLPNLMPTGNKDSRSLSRLEGILMGLGNACGVLPGISGVGTMLSVASVSGVEMRFALDLTLLVHMVATVVLGVLDIAALFAGTGVSGFGGVVSCVAAAAAAYLGVCLGVKLMRVTLGQKGLSVFAFYSLAVALLSFVFFLMV